MACGESRELVPAKLHRTSRRAHELQDRLAHGGLATARLAHQRERTARRERKRDSVDRAHMADHALEQALADRKMHLEVGESAAPALRRASPGATVPPTRRRGPHPPERWPSNGWQRTCWPSMRCHAGASLRQRAITEGQRSAKRQPTNSRSSGGTVPARSQGTAAQRLEGSAAKSLRE